MKDWCMEHPYLTSSIVMFGIIAFNNIVVQIAGLIKKPAPMSFHLNMEKGSEKNEEVVPPSDKLN